MPIGIYFKLFTKVGFKRIGGSFIKFYGLFKLLLSSIALFFPNGLDFGWIGYFGLIGISIICAVIERRPKRSLSQTLSSPDSVVEIKVGDIFDEEAHLVIGANDVFDTELGEIMKPSSVQGQFLTKVYDNEREKLDVDIEKALQPLKHLRKEESEKIRGKTVRYPIGTTITLGTEEKRYFLTAYGYMNNDITIKSCSDYIQRSLNSLWSQIRLKGHRKNVAIPIIGSDLARTDLPRMALIRLIVDSFVTASKEKSITDKLTIMVYPKDLDYVDLYKLKDFLKSACF
ncbi:MAG: macro domain-containing protein [Rivularia sp. (in: cyanobacteria)]